MHMCQKIRGVRVFCSHPRGSEILLFSKKIENITKNYKKKFKTTGTQAKVNSQCQNVEKIRA